MLEVIYILQILQIILIFSNCSSLGQNLIANSKFSSPRVDVGKVFQEYSSIPGWSCIGGCQLDNCHLQNKKWIDTKRIYGDCDDQVLDISNW